uniref:Uncharacterized protein n=1 Tax=Panagrolaimus davidi TaxID=227884 RepID=A0A914PHE4_9BILA
MPTKDNAGIILYSNVDGIVQPRQFASLSTGIHLVLPAGYYGRAASLNKLAKEHSIKNYTGVIDKDLSWRIKELSETTFGECGFGSTGTDKIDAGGDAITTAIEEALSFKKIDKDAQEPVYGTPFAAEADVYSYEETTVPAGGKALISTGIKLSVKPGHYGRLPF